MHTLVIDTSYGSTVGIVGHEPISETDSRTHVERLQADIDAAFHRASANPHDLERIIVGIGPAPFTGLRAGIVTAQALAFATGAVIIPQDDLTPNAALMHAAHRHEPWLRDVLDYAAISRFTSRDIGVTLALNDARRKQLYFTLTMDHDGLETPTVLIDMDIDRPDAIADRVQDALDELRERHPQHAITLDIVGHGARKYADAWQPLDAQNILDTSPLDLGAPGMELFARHATGHVHAADPASIEPLYLRRPDVSVPNPLKHVLGHAPTKGNAV